MQSKELILTEQKVIVGDIRNQYSNIDSDKISESLRKDLEKTTFGISNKFYDINLTYHGQHSWIYDLIQQQIYAYHNINYKNINCWGNLETFNESSITRNNLFLEDVHNQPWFTLIYILKAGENPGELILKYQKPTQRYFYQNLNVQEGNFYLFNSNIDYFFSKNLDKKDREYITWTCLK
jgi:hypothetical protein|tara:strand:- start:468 stop:1007 length:540 start_codon:yes stop_codon:yes gene_type:complete